MNAPDGGSRSPGRRGRFVAVSLALAALLIACGSSDEASTGPAAPEGDGSDVDGRVVDEPPPSSMCPEGSAPQVVAYDDDGGGVRWISCSDDAGHQSLLPVADGVVHVATFVNGAVSKATALDAATGEPVEDAPPPPPRRGVVEGQSYTGEPTRVELDGVVVIGGQDDGVRAISTDGTELWSRPGVWTYDDVWAIDDGAVFAFERETSRLAAYEVETGDVRWAHEGDPYREGLWPYHAVDGRLYTLWSNLQVRSTADGALLWRTAYPTEEMEAADLRMTAVETDGTSVFVSFATQGSGGD
jgi:outer membrane protein assembly factor BamB